MARKIFLPTASALVEKTLLATTSMYAWMRDITAAVTNGGGPAPADATYFLKTANGSLTNALVATDSTTVTLDYSVAGQVSWHAANSSRQLWQYRAKTTATSGYPGNGYILWDNATQISATNLLFSHLTDDDLDIDIFLSFLAAGQDIILQDADASANVQKWTISGAPTNTNPGMPTSYWTIPVTFVSSGGTGTTGFANNHQIVAVIFAGTGPGSGNVTTSVTLTNNNLVVGNGGTDIKVAAALDGQVPIGTTADGSVTLANLMAGSGITITNGPASISIATAGGLIADYVVMSNGANPPTPVDDGAGNFIYVGYTP